MENKQFCGKVPKSCGTFPPFCARLPQGCGTFPPFRWTSTKLWNLPAVLHEASTKLWDLPAKPERAVGGAKGLASAARPGFEGFLSKKVKCMF